MVMLSRLLLTQHKRFVPQGTHPNRASFGLENRIYINDSRATSDNTAYMLRANALPFGTSYMLGTSDCVKTNFEFLFSHYSTLFDYKLGLLSHFLSVFYFFLPLFATLN